MTRNNAGLVCKRFVAGRLTSDVVEDASRLDNDADKENPPGSPPPLRSGGNQALERTPLRALLNCRIRQAFIEEKEKMEAKSSRAKSGESTRVVTSYVLEQNSY